MGCLLGIGRSGSVRFKCRILLSGKCHTINNIEEFSAGISNKVVWTLNVMTEDKRQDPRR